MQELLCKMSALIIRPGHSLSAHFISMVRYPHFADFQVRSSLNCSQKDQWFDLEKKRKNTQLLLKLQWFTLFKIFYLTRVPSSADSFSIKS